MPDPLAFISDLIFISITACVASFLVGVGYIAFLHWFLPKFVDNLCKFFNPGD